MSLFFDTREVEELCVLPSFGASLKFPTTRTQAQYTHWIFNRYPARSIADIPRCIVRAAKEKSGFSRLKVLDPFMGSGTTAVETLLAGAEAYGVEADAFARLIATVRTTPLSDSDLMDLEVTATRITKSLTRSRRGPVSDLPDVPNVGYWFPSENIVQLRRLRGLIEQECERDEFKRFLLVVLAELVRPCSYAERQTLKPYISKRFPKQPTTVLESWLKHLPRNLEALRAFSHKVGPDARPLHWLGTDATTFQTDVRCDIAITSPPYVNALDYIRCTKFESSWLGLSSESTRGELRKLLVGEPARINVNSTPSYCSAELQSVLSAIEGVDSVRAKIVQAYVDDLVKNLRCVGNALKPGATYWVIVGENEIRGVRVSTHLILANVATQMRFTPTHLFRYVLRDHRTSIPRRGRGGKIEYEYVLGLTKAA